MKSHKFKIIGLIILIIFVSVAWEAFEAENDNDREEVGIEEIEFDNTYSERSGDNFSFDYPGEWERRIVRDRYEDQETIEAYVPDVLGNIYEDEEVTHQLMVNYVVDSPLHYRANEEEFYMRLERDLEETKEMGEIEEVIISEEKEFLDKPAYELKTKMSSSAIPAGTELIQHTLRVYENDHDQLIAYIARPDEYSERVANKFFESFEFTTPFE